VLADVDMALIEQALVNLIDNAVKYCPEKARISIAAAALDDEVVIRVADNGTGIPKKAQARLFERFYRVDHARSRQLGGTGLGLAIVKHIAKLHGGRVSIDSTVGKGSTFLIHLPSPGSQVHASPPRRISAQAVARSHPAAGSL
jgi:two-component system phosphate regulon sensor histidine kinase PhoR